MARSAVRERFITPVPVRWSDIDMYQHVNHATMVTILEEARVPFLTKPFADDFATSPAHGWLARPRTRFSPSRWRPNPTTDRGAPPAGSGTRASTRCALGAHAAQ